MYCLGALQRRTCLSNAFGSFKSDGCEGTEELVNLIVDDPPLIGDRSTHLGAAY